MMSPTRGAPPRLGSRVLPPANESTHHHRALPEDGNMAVPSVPATHTSSCYGSEIYVDVDAPASLSDYGSEFDATEIDEDTLLASTLDLYIQKAPRSAEKVAVLPSIEFEQGEAEDEYQDDLVVIRRPSLLRVAKTSRRVVQDIDVRWEFQSSPVRETLEVEYDERSRRAWSGVLLQLNWLHSDRLTTNSA